MKKLSILALVMLALAVISCHNDENSGSNAAQPSASTSTQQEVQPMTSQDTLALAKAIEGEHANPDASYSYDSSTNTISMVKEIELGANYDELEEYQKFLDQFNSSSKPSDVTIKDLTKRKGADIIVYIVNKADKCDTITSYYIVPEELK